MAVSRGMYGQAGRITTEYFFVEARIPGRGCYTDLVAAPTKGMAYSQMAKKYSDCKVTLSPCPKDRYMAEMADFHRWEKERGGARGPEPIL
jgi:hypothetical protein